MQRIRDVKESHGEAQARSPHGPEHLGPPEEPRQPPRIRPRPARPTPQGQDVRLGTQLRAKQKLKGYYANVTEKQFRRYYAEAIRQKGDSGENLIGLLERRLDAVVYRSKFVATPFAARQFVNHGHVKVNGRRVNIPSYLVKPGDVIEVKDKSKQMELVVVAAQLPERDVPDYIEVDHSKMTARMTRVPTLSEVPYAVQMEPNLVIEFYSR